MTDYQANVTADFSGYTSSVQQAMALTKEYTAAHEGMMSVVTKTGAKAINKFNDVMGVTAKVTKANVAEAANYQQVLGKVSAAAKASGESIGKTQKATKEIARTMTGDIRTATDLVSELQKSGYTAPKQIKELSKAVVELGAATGESGTEIAASLKTIQASYGKAMDPKQIANLGDSLVTVTSQFGASASAAAGFSKNVAPFAQQIGMSQSSLLGFSTAFARMGESGFRSSNVFAKVLSDIDLAVREGLPTMSTYATAMGKTYEEAMNLAKDNPTEFVVQFTEALQKQGSGAIRTLEALGLEGVRSQKAMSALTSGTDLREMVSTAQQAYGSGSTGEAAQEQLNGLNEQTMLLQESMKELVTTTGQPMLKWLEEITGVSAKAADAMAGLADSPVFQFIAGTGGMAMAGGALALKGINMAWTAGGIGAALGQLNAMGGVPGQPGRVERGMSFIGANRGKLMGAGMLGMMAAPMLEQPGLGTLGMGALMAGTLIGPNTFQRTARAVNFLTTDAMAAWRTPFTQWGKKDFSLEKRVLGASEFDKGAGRFMATGSADQRAYVMKQMKAMGLTDEAKLLSQSWGHIIPSGEGKGTMAGSKELARIADEVKKGSSASTTVIREQTRLMATQAAGMVGVEGAGAARAKYMAKQLGGVGTGAVRGLGTQLMAIPGAIAGLGAPALLAGGAVAAIGAGVWLNKQADEREESRRSKTIKGREEAYEKFGLVANTFEGVQLAGDNLTNTFEKLSGAIQAAMPKEGEEEVHGTGLTASEFGAIDTSQGPSTELNFQNRRFLWQTTGSQLTGTSAMSELIGTYGAKGTADSIAMIATDLKAMGKTQAEVDDAVQAYKEATAKGPQGVLELAVKDWKENRNTGAWEEETFDDTIRAAFADYAPNMGNQAITGTMLSEVNKAVTSGELTASEVADLRKDFAEAIWGEGAVGPKGEGGKEPVELPELEVVERIQDWYDENGQRVAGETDAQFQARAEAAGKRNEEKIDEWMEAAWGRPMGEMEGKLSGVMPGTPEGELNARARLEAMRQTVAEETAAGREYVPTAEQMKEAGVVLPEGQTWAGLPPDEAAAQMVDTFSTAVSEWQEGQTGKNLINTQIMANQVVEAAGGDVAKAMETIREQMQEVSPESAAGQALAGQMAVLEERRGIEVAGMGRWQGLQTREADYKAMLESAGAELAEGNTGPEVQAELEEGAKGMKQVMQEKVGFMQDYLRAYQGFQNQQRYAEEDYNRSVRYAEQDYATQRRQATEQYQKSVRYATEDHQKQMRYMEEDYQKTMVRAERDYYKQRDRMAAEYAKSIRRRAEDAAKAMYDPFQRMAVEQTWSAEGLLGNLSEQLEAFQKQAENLNSLRGMGVSQSVIDMLGLNDPQKAQQLERMLGDLQQMPNGADIIAQLNANVGERTDIAGILFGEENDLGARRMAEDYATQLQYMTEDRNTWLADAEADYNQATKRAEDAFITSMERMREGFDTQMRYMSEAHVRAMERMGEGHATAMQRAQEAFTLQFQTFTTNYEKLADQMTNALTGKPVEWATITKEGTDGIVEELNAGYDTANTAWMTSLVESVEAAWGKDSYSSDVVHAVVTLLGSAGKEEPTGGGPTGEDFPTTPGAPSTSSGSVTGGKGSVTQVWNNPGSYGPSGNGPHTGIDIGVPSGTPLYTKQAARVVGITNSGNAGYGLHVTLQDTDESVQLLYAHMSSVGVTKGQTLGAGAFVGTSGWSGNVRPKSPQGAHLHFEARVPPYGYGNDINPSKWLALGGIVTGPSVLGMGEAGHEAVIPLNSRGVDILAEALAKAYSTFNSGTTRGSDTTTYVSYTTNEDHSVNVNGPVEVVSADPERIGRELERAARLRAMVTPSMSRS